MHFDIIEAVRQKQHKHERNVSIENGDLVDISMSDGNVVVRTGAANSVEVRTPQSCAEPIVEETRSTKGPSMTSRIAYGFASLGLAFVLSFIAMAISLGEDCGFSPGMLVVAIFGPMLLGTAYGGGGALAMFLIGFAGKRTGVYINAGIVVLALALFLFLAVAAQSGFVPWHSRCTIDF